MALFIRSTAKLAYATDHLCIHVVQFFRRLSGKADARSVTEYQPILFAMASACAHVEVSAAVGSNAIISRKSPKISERTTASTCAGTHHAAKRSPLTAESRLQMLLIPIMSAPQAKSCFVISCNSSSGTRGCSNNALPLPESKKQNRLENRY